MWAAKASAAHVLILLHISVLLAAAPAFITILKHTTAPQPVLRHTMPLRPSRYSVCHANCPVKHALLFSHSALAVTSATTSSITLVFLPVPAATTKTV